MTVTLGISCSQCRHWHRKISRNGSDSYAGIENLGECQKAVQLWDAATWDEDGERKVRPEYQEQMSFVHAFSDYSARLWTKEGFFCGHFEPKVQHQS